MNRIAKRMAAPIGAALIVGTSGFAFMASNSVPVTSAGEGSNAITGYQVSNVHYVYQYYGAPGIQSISNITFDLDKRAATVSAFLTGQNAAGTATQAEFRGCQALTANGRSWTCAINTDNQRAMLVDVNKLWVAAAQ